MNLTIIPVDGAVGVDGVFHLKLDLTSCKIPDDVHALQWRDDSGWVEFKEPIPNQTITELPDWANCCLGKWEEADNAPTPDPLPPTEEENKQKASGILYSTDWTTIPDVSDPTKSNPYLSNVQEFVDYRNAIRQYAIYPVAGYIDWPTAPTAVWVNA